jgi:hypothetical protein
VTSLIQGYQAIAPAFFMSQDGVGCRIDVNPPEIGWSDLESGGNDGFEDGPVSHNNKSFALMHPYEMIHFRKGPESDVFKDFRSFQAKPFGI